MKSFKVGVVGLGWVAGAHIETLKHVKGAEVVGVSSRRKWTAAQLEAKYGLALKSYDSYEEMLKDPSIDVIDICTPHPLHAAQAIAAANAGKHLIIEKPLATSYADTVA
ncbi:MAG: Gfo/Idh/MocA family oxidoreductase, partial [Bryobacteraceae bacterium]|nr:Gfo/Idh/MocA family oxidoreductase [Bryobacteraceae bacterium]